MDFPPALSAPLRSTLQNHVADRSPPPRSRCAFLPAARSSRQTLQHGTQRHQVHRPRNSQRPFRTFDFHGSRRQCLDIPLHRFSSLFLLNLHRQKLWVHADAQPPFAKQLSPVEHLVGIYIVSSGHSRYRGSRHQGLFHDAPLLFNGSPTFLRLCRRRLRSLTECVHDSSSWTQLKVSTKTIIFDYSHSEQTVRIGRLRTSRSQDPQFRKLLLYPPELQSHKR